MNNPYNSERRRWPEFLIFLVVVLLLNFTTNLQAAKDSNIENEYIFSSEQTTNRTFGSCDATNEYFYFSYAKDVSCVDVYDHSLNYLYTIEFRDIQNSSLYLRTEQDLLYIRLRCGNVYVFRGQEEISRMTREKADEAGLTEEWFLQANSRLQLKENTLYYWDEMRNLSETVELPEILTSSPNCRFLLNALAMISLVAIMLFSHYRRSTKAKNTQK